MQSHAHADARYAVSTALLAELRSKIPAGRVLTNGPEYAKAAALFNAAVDFRPLVVVRCVSTTDVQAGVRAARSTVALFVVPGPARTGGNCGIRPRGRAGRRCPATVVGVAELEGRNDPPRHGRLAHSDQITHRSLVRNRRARRHLSTSLSASRDAEKVVAVEAGEAITPGSPPC